MGYYADTSWDITFKDEQAVAWAHHFLAAQVKWTFDHDLGWLINVGEEATEEWDGLHLVGWTGGKLFYDFEDALKILKRYASGTIEVNACASNDGHCKWVLADGEATLVPGRIVYADEAVPKKAASVVIASITVDGETRWSVGPFADVGVAEQWSDRHDELIGDLVTDLTNEQLAWARTQVKGYGEKYWPSISYEYQTVNTPAGLGWMD